MGIIKYWEIAQKSHLYEVKKMSYMKREIPV